MAAFAPQLAASPAAAGSVAAAAAARQPVLPAATARSAPSFGRLATGGTIAAAGAALGAVLVGALGRYASRGGVARRARPGPRAVACRAASGAAGAPATLHIGIVGYGLVGKELVSQILDSAPRLEKELGVRAEVSAVARAQSMALLAPGGQGALQGGGWPAAAVAADLEQLAEHLLAAARASGGRAMIVDNTASDAPAELYEAWLAAGIDVATPNKRAGSGPLSRYERILAAQRRGGARFLYESTVGAGLPIVAPLQTLLRAGDKVAAVEGIFSGTLSYIFNTWKPGMKFSEVVNDAKNKGFTEPDPRDDLSGTDVARKVTILARECGLKLELADVPVKSLVPAALESWQPAAGEAVGDAFIKELEAYDAEMDALISEAEAAGEVLRFVGAVDLKAGTSSVKLSRYPKDHPFAATQFADNIVTFDTAWYNPRPLVVQGPGAGAAVTAAGIFGNVVEVMSGMRCPSQ